MRLFCFRICQCLEPKKSTPFGCAHDIWGRIQRHETDVMCLSCRDQMWPCMGESVFSILRPNQSTWGVQCSRGTWQKHVLCGPLSKVGEEPEMPKRSWKNLEDLKLLSYTIVKGENKSILGWYLASSFSFQVFVSYLWHWLNGFSLPKCIGKFCLCSYVDLFHFCFRLCYVISLSLSVSYSGLLFWWEVVVVSFW